MSFKTSDTYFAAYLLSAKVTMVGMEDSGSIFTFVFEEQDSRVVRELKTAYFSGYAKVSALDYSQKLKHLKSEMKRREK